MSQQKVDRYKEYKKNRKAINEKEIRKKKTGKILGILIAVACIGGLGTAIGVTGYNSYKSYKESQPVYEREAMVVNDVAGIVTDGQ